MPTNGPVVSFLDLELYSSLATSKKEKGWAEIWKAKAKTLIANGKHIEAKLILEAVLEDATPDLESFTLHIRACMENSPVQTVEALQSASNMAIAAQNIGTEDAQSQATLAQAAAHLLAARDTPSMGSAASQAHITSAHNLLLQLTQQQPNHASAQYHLALLLATTGRHDLAVQHTKLALAAAATSHSPALQPSMALLALLLSARAEHQAALAVIAKAQQASQSRQSSSGTGTPSSTPASSSSSFSSVDLLLHRIKAAVLAASGDHSSALLALATFKKRLDLEQLSCGRTQMEALLWRDMAGLYLAQGLVSDAQQCAQQLAKLQPHSAATHCTLGAVREAQGDLQAAIGCYSSALALEPSHMEAMLALGSLHRRSGTAAGLAEARYLLGSVQQVAARRSQVWREAGLLAQAAGDVVGAEEKLAQAVLLASTEPVVSYEELPLVL